MKDIFVTPPVHMAIFMPLTLQSQILAMAELMTSSGSTDCAKIPSTDFSALCNQIFRSKMWLYQI